MSKTILITGASSGFGALTARALADAVGDQIRRWFYDRIGLADLLHPTGA